MQPHGCPDHAVLSSGVNPLCAGDGALHVWVEHGQLRMEVWRRS
jgi:hypothetical protein